MRNLRDGSMRDSEMEMDAISEKQGEEQLERLGSEFLRLQGQNTRDPNLVGRLFIAVGSKMVRHFERRVNDAQHAEDAVQAAFNDLLKFHQRAGSLPDMPIAYLLRAAQSWLINNARKESNGKAVSLENVNSSTLDAIFDAGESARQPVEAVESSEIKAVAYAALDELDETTRRIIELRRGGGEWDEIARKVGLANGELARKKFEHAEHHVSAALGRQFSSFITTAHGDIRRWINSRKAAEQAIELLPPPYAETLTLVLVRKMNESDAARTRKVPAGEVRRDYERGIELFHGKFKITEAELRALLAKGR